MPSPTMKSSVAIVIVWAGTCVFAQEKLTNSVRQTYDYLSDLVFNNSPMLLPPLLFAALVIIVTTMNAEAEDTVQLCRVKLVGEVEAGTMLLLLSYPVSRIEVILGKFLGGSAIISFATLVGYGLSGLIVGMTSQASPSVESWMALIKLIGPCIDIPVT